jgi:hypothetical protein
MNETMSITYKGPSPFYNRNSLLSSSAYGPRSKRAGVTQVSRENLKKFLRSFTKTLKFEFSIRSMKPLDRIDLHAPYV